jgi:hypothetical protein
MDNRRVFKEPVRCKEANNTRKLIAFRKMQAINSLSFALQGQ